MVYVFIHIHNLCMFTEYISIQIHDIRNLNNISLFMSLFAVSHKSYGYVLHRFVRRKNLRPQASKHLGVGRLEPQGLKDRLLLAQSPCGAYSEISRGDLVQISTDVIYIYICIYIYIYIYTFIDLELQTSVFYWLLSNSQCLHGKCFSLTKHPL